MTSPLHNLEGLTVTKVVEIHDYVQLHFGDDVGISIYNEIETHPGSTAIAEFVGRIMSGVVERDNEIEFTFLDGAKIRIDMHPEACRGPEALELHRHGHPTVIWN